MKIICLLALLLVTVKAQMPCPTDAIVKIGGTDSVQQLAQAWADAYMARNEFIPVNSNSTSLERQGETGEFDVIATEGHLTASGDCPMQGVDIGGYGWATGGARVCGLHPIYDDVDIAGMYGTFFQPQAGTTNGWSYECTFSQRRTTLLHVGYEGIALVAAAHSVASKCINDHLGGGLSTDQMRWIFSSYGMEELLEIGMPPGTVPNSDGDDSTHLWSELNENCDAEEIAIASADFDSYTSDFLNQNVLKRNGEIIRATTEAEVEGSNTTEVVQRTFSSLERAMEFLEENGEAIAVIRIGDLRNEAVRDNSDAITTIGIMNKFGRPFRPEAEWFSSGDYILSKSLHLGVWDNPRSLLLTRPLLQFGLSSEGTKILENAGFWSIDEWEKIVMRTRLQTQTGIDMQEIAQSCGREDGMISMAGSSAVYPIARIWKAVYKSGCPTVDIDVEEGGSSAGAGRVCANPLDGQPVDIGMMSREWQSSEGQPRSGQAHIHDCVGGDQSFSAIEIDVAYDGVSMIVKKGGIADECQELLGGFTVDQLRWIYSAYSEQELVATGWDPQSLTNSDNDPNTHLWSELDPGCAPDEIFLAGGVLDEGSHTFFRKVIMKDSANGEDIDLSRPLGYFQALGFNLVSHLQSNGDAIAFSSFNSYHDNMELLSAAAVRNSDGKYVKPSAATIGAGTYSPLKRSISMNLLNDQQTLLDTVPFLKFGFAHPALVNATGMVPVTGTNLEEMVLRLDAALAEAGAEIEVDDNGITLVASKTASSAAMMLASPWWGLVMAGWLFVGL